MPSAFDMKNTLFGIISAGLAFCACAGAVGKSTPAGFTDDLDAACAEGRRERESFMSAVGANRSVCEDDADTWPALKAAAQDPARFPVCSLF